MIVPEYLIISLLIAFFAIIQSIFGLGILVFGTPTLLLLGYEFLTSLTILIPASIAISLSQVLTINFKKPRISTNLYYLTIPSIAIGLVLSVSSLLEDVIIILISFMLILSATIKLGLIDVKINNKFVKNLSFLYHFFLGLIHGLTNLGGALLPLLSNGKNDEKNILRYKLSYYYLVFTTTQFTVLIFLLDDHLLLFKNIYTFVIALLIYLCIGNRLFILTNNRTYNILFSFFMLLYALILLIKLIWV